jgi:hypothetical protein
MGLWVRPRFAASRRFSVIVIFIVNFAGGRFRRPNWSDANYRTFKLKKQGLHPYN